jgi:tRNA(Ile)-lysidine synthase
VTRLFDDAIRGFEPVLPLGVGFSGGADSSALLIACARKWPGEVVALHVNHGLQAAAPRFEEHCRHLCSQHDIPIRVQRIDASATQGQSPEDAARRARYKCFEAFALAAQGQLAINSIAIAQHADDQVETMLLALSRGAGLGGLGAMPSQWTKNGVEYHRPLLRISGADVRAWLSKHDIAPIEDPTNRDEQFTRNRIRARLLPALESAFPHFRETFARSAQHAAQADGLLTDLALEDFAGVTIAGTCQPVIKLLQRLSLARRVNVLRYWLKSQHAEIPSTAQMDELVKQIAACQTKGHRIRLKVGSGFVERKGLVLAWYN